MVKSGKHFRLWIEPEVHAAREDLPGNVRQRVRRIMASLVNDPRPTNSRVLDVDGLDIPVSVEIRRLRLEKWRILYAIKRLRGGYKFTNGLPINTRIYQKLQRN